MKKLFLALFLVASGLSAQQAWTSLPDAWILLNGGLPIPAGYLTIQDEGSNIAQEATLNFIGGAVTCVDNAGSFRTDCTITSAGAYSTIMDEAGALTQRATVNFTGAGVTCVDNAGATRTDCTIPAATTIPTGTGFWHITGGASDAASKLVDNADVANRTALSLWGRSANSSGAPADIAATAASDCVFRENGSVLGCGTVATAGHANASVTLAKIQNAAANSKLVGSGSAGSGASYSEITIGTGLNMASTTLNAGKLFKSFTLENPTAAENISMFYTPNAITITEVRCVVKGSASPSVTYNVAYGTDRSAAGTNVTTSPSACTNTTTGVTATLNNTAPAAGAYLWLTTSAQSGTVTDINVTVTYTEP